MAIGENFPKGWWPLDGTSPHVDISGYGRTATSSSATYAPALASGMARSLVVSNSTKISYPNIPVFRKNKEYLPFTIEAVVRPVLSGAVGEQQIFGNDGAMDGLIINGSIVSFVTKYTSRGEARAFYDLSTVQRAYVVGVHTPDRNALYVNGVLVDDVEITLEQQNDTYAHSSTSMSSGASATSNSLMLNAVGFYDTPIDDEAVMFNYAHLQDVLRAEDIATAYGGALIELSAEHASPSFQTEYSYDEDWYMGMMEGVATHDDTLYPDASTAETTERYWEATIPLDNESNKVQMANLQWVGSGVIVQTSGDGENWTTLSNGSVIPTVRPEVPSEEQMVFIRVSFTSNDTELSYMDSLKFSLFETDIAANEGGRDIVLHNTAPEGDYDVMDLNENWGAEMNNGSITIKEASSATSIVPKTVEVWARKEAGTFTDNLALNATRTRSNGGESFNYRNGEWQLRHYVSDTGFAGDIVFSGTGQIGHIVIYEAALTNEEIKAIYDNYVGKMKTTLPSGGTMEVEEWANSVDIYEYDWSIETS